MKPWLKRSGRYRKVRAADDRRIRVPRWLLRDSGGLTAVAVLGLTRYYEARPDPELRTAIIRLCSALAAFQYGDFSHAPYGAHMSWSKEPGLWHGWGSRQVQALAYAGRILGRGDFIASAKREADQWLSRLVVTGVPYQVTVGGESRFFEQIPYAQSSAVMGLSELGRATGDKRYHAYAGLLASWFFGNNVTGMPMYDRRTGRGYDGISRDQKGALVRNINAGGEATIEALMAVLDAASNPVSRRTMRMTRHHRPEVVSASGKKRALPVGALPLRGEDILSEMRVFENPQTSERLRVLRDFRDQTVLLTELPPADR